MFTCPYTNFPFIKHKNRENGDCSLYKNRENCENRPSSYTKIAKMDTVLYTKTAKIDTIPGSTSPVPKLYIVHPRVYIPSDYWLAKTKIY